MSSACGALVDAPSALARVPLFLLALLVVRALPAVVYVPALGGAKPSPPACSRPRRCRSWSPPPPIGVTLGEIKPVNGAALVSAGLLSVVVFPLVALSLLRSAPDTVDSTR